MGGHRCGGRGRVPQAGQGLGLSEYRAPEALSLAPACERRMQALAMRLQLGRSSVSRMVERRERDGLSVRNPGSRDRRGVYTVLTDKGPARFQSAQPDDEEALNAALGDRNRMDPLVARFIRADRAV